MRQYLKSLKQTYHKEFHCWHEGFDKPCTISDFRLFIEAKYSSNYELLSELDERKRTLEAKLKSSSKFLALPATSPTPTPAPLPIEPSKTPETNTTSFSELEIVTITSKDSINRDILGKATFATINNQKVKGKILAICKCADQKTVCFQKKEGETGIWLPESAFINE